MRMTGREAFWMLTRAGVPSRRLIYFSERRLKTFAAIYRHDGEVPEAVYFRG